MAPRFTGAGFSTTGPKDASSHPELLAANSAWRGPTAVRRSGASSITEIRRPGGQTSPGPCPEHVRVVDRYRYGVPSESTNGAGSMLLYPSSSPQPAGRPLASSDPSWFASGPSSV